MSPLRRRRRRRRSKIAEIRKVGRRQPTGMRRDVEGGAGCVRIIRQVVREVPSDEVEGR